MEQILKQRLVGAAVLVSVGVLFLPVLFEGVPMPEEPRIETTNIPPKPETGFNSRIIPLERDAAVTLPAPPVTPAAPESAPAPTSTPTPTPATIPPPTQKSGSTSNITADATAAPANAAANKPAEKPQLDKSTNKAGAVQPKVEKPPGGKNPPEQTLANKSPPPAAPAKSSVSDKSEQRVGVAAWVVQLGSFGSEQNAKELEARLQKQGYAAFVEKLYASDGQKFRVRIGPELMRTKAQDVRDKVEKDLNLKGIVVRYP
jgi:DedD protein